MYCCALFPLQLCLLMLRQRLLTLRHSCRAPAFLSVGGLITIHDEAQSGGVFRKLEKDVGVVPGGTARCKQSTQEGTKHTSLWCSCAQSHCRGSVATDFHHLWSAHQRVHNPVSQMDAYSYVSERGDALGWDDCIKSWAVINEQHSHTCVFSVQVWEGSVHHLWIGSYHMQIEEGPWKLGGEFCLAPQSTSWFWGQGDQFLGTEAMVVLLKHVGITDGLCKVAGNLADCLGYVYMRKVR